MRASTSARLAAHLRASKNIGVRGRMRWSSTQPSQAVSDGEKPISQHVSITWWQSSPREDILLIIAGRILQDVCETNCESPAHGDVYLPIGILGLGEAGER